MKRILNTLSHSAWQGIGAIVAIISLLFACYIYLIPYRNDISETPTTVSSNNNPPVGPQETTPESGIADTKPTRRLNWYIVHVVIATGLLICSFLLLMISDEDVLILIAYSLIAISGLYLGVTLGLYAYFELL